MSKLDQLKALREARIASRNISDRSDEAKAEQTKIRKSGGLAEERLGPSKRSPLRASDAVTIRMSDGRGDAPRPPETIRKRGRPRIGETRDKPWEAAGMSERTWYRRQKEKAK